MLKNVE